MTLLIKHFHLQVKVTAARDASGTHKFLILQIFDFLILNLLTSRGHFCGVGNQSRRRSASCYLKIAFCIYFCVVKIVNSLFLHRGFSGGF